MKEISEDRHIKGEVRAAAARHRNQVSDFEFVFFLLLWEKVLASTNIVSKYLQ